ncbi:hypothetical protein DUI87_27705 [Hirundo rustica rustica]|uniref:Uncharacterized protein n=1 Tax=Hirundo rustica rustica TaxID=333673 RepID=A0A3M0J470_HIRRU|nr:hypothetical protein DUI87_27705 [Hirundo rustica rustica]
MGAAIAYPCPTAPRLSANGRAARKSPLPSSQWKKTPVSRPRPAVPSSQWERGKLGAERSSRSFGVSGGRGSQPGAHLSICMAWSSWFAAQVLPAKANGFRGSQADGKCSWSGVAFLAILFHLEGQCCHAVLLVSAEGVNCPGNSMIQLPAPERPLEPLQSSTRGGLKL